MKKITKILVNSTLTLISLILFLSCTESPRKAEDSGDEILVKKDSTAVYGDVHDIKPNGPAPVWAPHIKPQMLAVIEKLESYNDKPIAELTAGEARKNHTPTDAVMDLVKKYKIEVPAPKCDTIGKDIPAIAGGVIHLRIYTPKERKARYPVIVYYHGGGFVIANLDVYNASAQALCEKTSAIVVSVAYRLAPENKFPTAHNDAFTAYKWVVDNASSFNGEKNKIAIAGESAGGNLAINTAIMARDKKITLPVAILAVYPIANADMNSPSYLKNSDAKPLNKAMMQWFLKNYLNNISEAKDARISLVLANLKGLPPTTIITADIDPLQSEGILITSKLKAAGVTVDYKNYDGVTHEFFGMALVVPQAKEAQNYAADQLKKEISK